MESTKETALQSLTHEMRAKIKPSFLISEVYNKMNKTDCNKSGLIEELYNWKAIAKVFPTKFNKFIDKPMDVDSKLRLAVKLSKLTNIRFNHPEIKKLEIYRNYDKQYFFIHYEADNWPGDLYIEDFDIKNEVDVAVMWILHNQGIMFYWEDGNWEMIEQDLNENDKDNDMVISISEFNKYNNLANEWKNVIRNYKNDIKPILKLLKQKSLSDIDRVWYSLILYLHYVVPEITNFQSPEEGNLWLAHKYKVIFKSETYEEYIRHTDDFGYCTGFSYYLEIADGQVYTDTLSDYDCSPHDVYDMIFNKSYWFNNYSPLPYYANKIKSFVSSESRYNRLLQFGNHRDLHAAIQSLQWKILRVFNFIKVRNQKNAAKYPS